MDSVIYALNTSGVKKIRKEEDLLKKIGVKYKVNDSFSLDIDCKFMLSASDTYVFNPLKYLNKLVDICSNDGVRIYENSLVSSICKDFRGYKCVINGFNVTAKYVVVATWYPYFLFPLLVPLRTSIEKSYVSASRVENNFNCSAITVDNPIRSMKFYKDYFIYLNGMHNICFKYNEKDNFGKLIDDLESREVVASYIWSNCDIMSEDNLPYIGEVDKNLYIETGYNAWGMTNGSLAGKIISDLILDNGSEYEKLFDPYRSMKCVNRFKYLLDILYNAKSYICNKIIMNKYWYKTVYITSTNGKSVGVYIDREKNKHFVYNKCPHLGCSLTFNEVEKTWDCPCHASRFDIDGKCIVGPSRYDIGIKKY